MEKVCKYLFFKPLSSGTLVGDSWECFRCITVEYISCHVYIKQVNLQWFDQSRLGFDILQFNMYLTFAGFTASQSLI